MAGGSVGWDDVAGAVVEFYVVWGGRIAVCEGGDGCVEQGDVWGRVRVAECCGDAPREVVAGRDGGESTDGVGERGG